MKSRRRLEINSRRPDRKGFEVTELDSRGVNIEERRTEHDSNLDTEGIRTQGGFFVEDNSLGITTGDLYYGFMRHTDLDPTKFWKLTSSGRCVEDVLFDATMKGCATVKMRSYTIDFNCTRTRALFSEEEWQEMIAFDQFTLPKLPKSTTQYLMGVRSTVADDGHPSLVAVPREDHDLRIRMSLYAQVPSAFTNMALTEAFWCREAWPLLKNLLSDVHGIAMIDGEKPGSESVRHRNHGRTTDMENTAPRKRSGAKLDLIAHDFVNKHDWFIVESPKEWDQQSTKFISELDVKLFRNLHLIAAHRLAEEPASEFRQKARFFSIYAGGMFDPESTESVLSGEKQQRQQAVAVQMMTLGYINYRNGIPYMTQLSAAPQLKLVMTDNVDFPVT
ncbi:hypothetical protein BGW41_007968 [Actinomortierella wolfii]|nr:hypothetical protein BGW41_007968 [Actinomortierella wolfii]